MRVRMVHERLLVEGRAQRGTDCLLRVGGGLPCSLHIEDPALEDVTSLQAINHNNKLLNVA